MHTYLPIGWVALLLGLCVAPALAQKVSKVGTTGAEFLQIGVGARAMALGGATVADVPDATAMYWNVAGLAHLGGGEALAAHAEWLADLDFDYVAVAFPAGGGHLGFSLTMLSVPDMLVRTEDRQDGTGETFDAADLAVGISYARTITDRFSVGATAKYIQQRIWHSTATAFAMDLGTQFRTSFFGGLVIGATLTNFGTPLRMEGRDLRTFVDNDERQLGNNDRLPVNFEVNAFELPLNFQFGLAWHPVDTRMHQLTVTADALHPSSNYESLNIGVEYGYQQRVFLRSGYNGLLLEDAEGGWSGGLGVHQPMFYGGLARLDYAYRLFGRLGGIHILGLALTF